MTEDERIAFEMVQALEEIEPDQRWEVAKAWFMQFNYIAGVGMVVNPKYRPTPTMIARSIRKEDERVKHERALEIARASAPIINIHNELPRRGWFR